MQNDSVGNNYRQPVVQITQIFGKIPQLDSTRGNHSEEPPFQRKLFNSSLVELLNNQQLLKKDMME